MLLSLKKDVIYGPVHSRRLGLSLGINVLPSGHKVCPFDCLYCQYGWTDVHQAVTDRRHSSFPTVEKVRRSLAHALAGLSRQGIRPAYLTFSGNGEPTLHPEFARLVEEVKAARDRWIPEAKTAVLSNSALVTKSSIRNALLELDLRIMKLDCGSERLFRRYNRPCRGIHLDEITEALGVLARRAPLTIQALITSGKGGNARRESIRQWVARLKRIRPASLQIYTLDRDCPTPALQPAGQDELQQVRGACEEEGVPAEVYL